MTMRIQLSKNFYMDEFTRSEIATRKGMEIEVLENSPEFHNIRRLCETVLQPIRSELGPVHITSGIRPLWLNRLVGSSDNSQHIPGMAADIVVTGHTPLQVCLWVQAAKLPYDQLIHEFGKWTHVSIHGVSGKGRNQELTATVQAGRTVYLPGLEVVA